MKIEDEAIVISAAKFGDKGIILKLFSRHHGIIKGMLSGQKKNMQTAQQGNHINFAWSARLEEHLGRLNAHIEKPYPLLNYNDYSKILAISSACSIIDKVLLERENMENLYDRLLDFLNYLDTDQWMKQYCLLELYILEQTGFGFDLTSCAITGEVDDLYYISPNTGAAATKLAGEKYKDKLFIIPEFFLEKQAETTISEVVEGLNITRYFLAKNFFAGENEKMPSPAISFIDEVLKQKRISSENGTEKRNYS